MAHYAISNPPRLGFERVPLTEDLILTARAPNGDQLSIRASRERWADLIRQAMTTTPRDPSEDVRAMYMRGELDLDEFERSLNAES